MTPSDPARPPIPPTRLLPGLAFLALAGAALALMLLIVREMDGYHDGIGLGIGWGLLIMIAPLPPLFSAIALRWLRRSDRAPGQPLVRGIGALPLIGGALVVLIDLVMMGVLMLGDPGEASSESIGSALTVFALHGALAGFAVYLAWDPVFGRPLPAPNSGPGSGQGSRKDA